jgi:hypothetical protein
VSSPGDRRVAGNIGPSRASSHIQCDASSSQVVTLIRGRHLR